MTKSKTNLFGQKDWESDLHCVKSNTLLQQPKLDAPN
jgi:hypothetical protein